jgi:Domain of unknown function (DUF4258)
MLKKYLPFVFLVAAALLYWYVKTNQRGALPVKPATEQKEGRITVPAVNPDDQQATAEGFNRNPTHIIYSKHAKCRMECRQIDESEVKEILQKGEINFSRIEKDEKGKSFPVEGVTHDKQRVRIVFAPKKEALVVVTVIDLDRDWSCDCK